MVATWAGAELTGNIFYPETRVKRIGCDPGGDQVPPNTIMLIDTEICPYTRKVINAQARGAAGVLLLEHSLLCTDPDPPCAGACGSGPVCTPPRGCICELPELIDDGRGGEVNIPVMLVSWHDGEPIKLCLLGLGDCPEGTTISATFQWYEPDPSPLNTTLWLAGPNISGFYDHKVSTWGSPAISGKPAQCAVQSH